MTPCSSFAIRKYRASDREAVRSICFLTGLMGTPVESIYGDKESFADMFSGYYTDVEPESAWVAVPEDDENHVVGYLLGCVDSRRAWDPARVGAKHAFLRGLLFRPGTAGFFFRLLGDVIRDGGVHRTPVDYDAFPAHFHTNLLPAARGGVGVRMHDVFVAHLCKLGVVGVHAETMAHNERALMITRKLGYHCVGESFAIPGMRDLEGKRIRGQLTAMDLRGDVATRALSSRANQFSVTAVEAQGAAS